MTIANDVPINKLIGQISEKLKEFPEMHPPEWSAFVKTGVSRERPPVEPDWWYTRSASILLKIQKLGPIGVPKLRIHYGGKKNRGVRPEKFKKGSGNILRKILQQLDSLQFTKKVVKEQKRGRIIQSKGASLIDSCSMNLINDSKKAPVATKPKVVENKDVKETKSEVVKTNPQNVNVDVKQKLDVVEKQKTTEVTQEKPEVVEKQKTTEVIKEKPVEIKEKKTTMVVEELKSKIKVTEYKSEETNEGENKDGDK